MNPTRREFIRASVATGGGLALGMGRPQGAEGAPSGPQEEVDLTDSDRDRKAPMSLLILGGTGFLGPHQVHQALARGHRVTIFTRGKTEPTVFFDDFDRVEQLVGDRSNDLEALKGREWDAVFDNSTSRWEWARDSAQLLKDSVGTYLFVSSTGVYWPYLTTNIDESVEPLTVDESGGRNGSAAYAVMKRLAEIQVQEAFGSRAVIARPQHFTGAGERQDRHGYWVERMDRGGEILAMGKPSDPVMLLDVRDLVDFMLKLVEERTSGVFNIAGPASPMTMEEFLHGLRFCTGEPVRWTWVDDYEFLDSQNLTYLVPWVLPMGTELGYTSINIDKALAAGLEHRPLAQTHFDFRTWWYSDAVPEERRQNLRSGGFMAREAEILRAWKARI